MSRVYILATVPATRAGKKFAEYGRPVLLGKLGKKLNRMEKGVGKKFDPMARI